MSKEDWPESTEFSSETMTHCPPTSYVACDTCGEKEKDFCCSCCSLCNTRNCRKCNRILHLTKRKRANVCMKHTIDEVSILFKRCPVSASPNFNDVERIADMVEEKTLESLWEIAQEIAENDTAFRRYWGSYECPFCHVIYDVLDSFQHDDTCIVSKARALVAQNAQQSH